MTRELFLVAMSQVLLLLACLISARYRRASDQLQDLMLSGWILLVICWVICSTISIAIFAETLPSGVLK